VTRIVVRIWLPDVPGVLGAVATTIGEHGGNVVGLEVLERDGGVAVDELLIELADPERIDAVCGALRLIEGVGVEEARPIAPGTEERGLQVMAVAVSILETANSDAALRSLMGHTGDLFDAEWVALADLRDQRYVQFTGEVPSIEWLAAFVGGARLEGARPADTTRSGVLTEELPGAQLTLCVGRSVPFRQRERREIEMLARVSDRVFSALEPRRTPSLRW
jgi:ACT domain